MQFNRITSEKLKTTLSLLFGAVIVGAGVKFVSDSVHQSHDYQRWRQAHEHASIGLIALNAKDYAMAIIQYRQAIALAPQNAVSYYNLGLAYHQNGDHENAIAAHQKAIELNPKDAKSHHQLGIVLMSKKQYDDAIPHFKQAIELEPNFPLPHGALGSIYSAQGKKQQAIEAFQTVLRLLPQNQNAKKGLEKLDKPDTGTLAIIKGSKFTKDYTDGFLRWQVDETPLGDWPQRIEGIVTWNQKSGAEGEPAVVMPVVLLRVNPDKKTLEPIAQSITDNHGRFGFRAPIGSEFSYAAMLERAGNIPPTVQHELAKRKKQ